MNLLGTLLCLPVLPVAQAALQDYLRLSGVTASCEVPLQKLTASSWGGAMSRCTEEASVHVSLREVAARHVFLQGCNLRLFCLEQK